MSVLITGGAGFIGSHTAVEFLNAGYDIIIVDNFSNSKPVVLDRIKKITGKDFKFYEVDLLDKEGLPTGCDFSAKELTEAALNDKKRKGDEIDLILPYSIGDSRIYSIPVSELEEIFIKGLTE